MATAEELLAQTGASDQILTIDLNTRVISIPAIVSNLGVASDDDVKRIYFRMPKQYGEFDMSKFDIRVNYMNADKKGGIYVVNDTSVDNTEGTLTFSWLLDRHVIEKAGDVIFNVCMKILDGEGVVIKEFNTTTATLPVKAGLETEEAVVENNPTAFDCVLARLYAVEAATGLGQDGHYNIVRVTENEDGVVFTLVDQDGEHEAVVKHGYVPVKGVDYWTAEDQQVMFDYINTWCPQAKSVTLPASGWVDNSQTVEVPGVIETSIVLVSYDPSDPNYESYIDNEVKCISQGYGTLTFQCEYQPDVDVKANVAVHYSADVASGGGSGGGGGIASVTDDGAGNVYLS